MTTPAQYTSVFRLLAGWLQADMQHLATRPDPTGLPPRNLLQSLPMSTIIQVGGTTVDVVIDLATVSIETYAADVESAEQIATAIRTGVTLRLPGYVLADRSAWVKSTRVVSGPKQLPYDSTALGRVGAVYQIAVRSQL